MLTLEELRASLDGGAVIHREMASQRSESRSATFGPFLIEEEIFYRIGRPEEVEYYHVTVRLPALQSLKFPGQDRVHEIVYATFSKVRDEPLGRVVSYLKQVDSCGLLNLGERIQRAQLGSSLGKPALERLNEDWP